MEKIEVVIKSEEESVSKNLSLKKGSPDVSALVLDTPLNKYDMILLARRWAHELKSKEGESRTLQELISVSIQDILSGDVSHKMVKELPALRNLKKQRVPGDLTQILHQIPSSSKYSSEKK